MTRSRLVLPSLTFLEDQLIYDPLTGNMYRKKSKGADIGILVGYIHASGYCRIKIGRRTYAVHRLAWYLMTGEQPPQNIDHINRDKTDNRWENLRCASDRENSINQNRRKDATEKYKGIHKREKTHHWDVSIRNDNQSYHVGCYWTAEEAAYAYNQKAIELFGDFAVLNEVDPVVEINPIPTRSKNRIYHGVVPPISSGAKWIAKYGKHVIGSFNTPQEAALARDAYCSQVPKHPRYLNFPPKYVELSVLTSQRWER